jgi:hypothetical protein
VTLSRFRPGYLEVRIFGSIYAVYTVAHKGHSRTKSEITPQYHETRQQMSDSRHNFTIHRHNSTIHATISRFTPQFPDSRHKETADRSRSQY